MNTLVNVLRRALQLLVAAMACSALHAAEHIDLAHGGLQRGYLGVRRRRGGALMIVGLLMIAVTTRPKTA